MALPAALSKEVGAGPLKLPLWGWAIAGVGGVILARKITAKPASSSTSDTPAAEPDTTASLPAGGVLTLGANGAVQTPGGAIDTPTASSITDNDAWRIAAINALVGGGYAALLSTSAVQKYLDGERLTIQETRAIEYALKRVGPTPYPVPPPLSTVPPPTPTPTKPPTPGPTPPRAVQQTSPLRQKPALGANHLPGEAFVDFANSTSGGTWWLTNWGGVAAVGAPFKGAPIKSRIAKALGAAPGGQTFVSIEPYGAGYLVRDNRADTGNYAYP